MARRLGNISRETIPILILFVAQQKPSRGGLWHPILMQFYSGPLMQLLSGVDTPTRISRPARHYPRLWIQRPSSERRRDFNPPDSCAAQRTLCPLLTSASRSGGLATASVALRRHGTDLPG